MAQKIFITATNTDIGKTYTSLKLIKAFSEMGYKVGVFKPIETGVAELPKDGKSLFDEALKYNSNLSRLSLDDIVPCQFKLPASPYVAKIDTKIDTNRLLQALNMLEEFCDILIIEGAGGLMVPVEKNLFIIDLIELFNAKALLVTPSKLGSINDTLLSLNMLKQRSIRYEWAVNVYEDANEYESITKPFYDDYFKTYFQLPKNLLEVAEQLMVK